MIQGARKFSSIMAAFLLIVATFVAVPAQKFSDGGDKKATSKASVEAPLNLAVLIQDDLVPKVGNELKVTRDFIRSLPAGSRVMVGYITSGSLQVRQPFTEDLDKAASSLRMPISSDAVSPYNPYVEVVQALKKFEGKDKNRNVVLLVSDGLDASRGLDVSSTIDSIDLRRAINEANRRNVSIYSFYAPSVGLTSRSTTLAGYGQSALNRLSNGTGGRAFFQGATDFVTFDGYFDRLREALNDQIARAY
ncbi:MAG: hypothetical protein ICV60_15045 [Pyrinomonadaceae bacterium]|nr:hypothetical protein [Pyrinomonadaceae bacterium]